MESKKFNLDFKFGGNIEFLNRLETLMSRVDKAFKSSEAEIDKTTVKTSKFNKELQKTSVTADKVGDGFAGLGNKIKFFAASFIGIKTIGTAVSAFREMESLRIDLGTMLGSQAEGDKFSNYIVDFAKKTPYAINQLSSLAKGMIQYNIPLDKTKELMQNIGDISMGDANKMGALGYVTSQIAALGKLQGQDYRQMLNTGFNPLTIISEMTGKSMTTLAQDMSKGKISFEMVAEAMKYATSEGGKFYKGMEKGSITLSGLISTAVDNMTMQLAEGVEKNQDSIKKIVKDFGEIDFSKLIGGFSDLAAKVMPLIEKLVDLIAVVGKMPNTFGLAATALISFKLGGRGVIDAFNGISSSAKNATNGIKEFNKAGAIAALGGGIIAGTTMEGEGKTTDVLSAMALGAAAGAVQFGALGAAIGAAAAGLTQLVSAYSSWQQQKEDSKKFEDNEIKKQVALTNIYSQRKRALGSDDPRVWQYYDELLTKYEAKYGQFDKGSYLVSHRQKNDVASAKNASTNIFNVNSNNTTQNNKIETSIDKLGLILDASLRNILERQMKISAETMNAMGAL